MKRLIFLKLGGSLITDKMGVEAVRTQLLSRLVREIAEAREACPEMQLLIGNGSGSFGHVAAARAGTRNGVHTTEQWFGFAQVSSAAARLNRLVTEALLAAGVPAVAIQPSASAVCRRGRIESMAISPIRAALNAGIVPVIYGDIAFDSEIGGTIVSTEEVMTAIAFELKPSWLLLAGQTRGVIDHQDQVIPVITQSNFGEVESMLGGSSGTDVTGGMASKVKGMLELVADQPQMAIRIFTGMINGNLKDVLLHHCGEETDVAAPGTIISAG